MLNIPEYKEYGCSVKTKIRSVRIFEVYVD